MSRPMRQVVYRGQVVWVDEHDQILGIAGGGFGGAEPGLSNAREQDIMSRLPDADIVGLQGPGVVPGGERAVGARRAEVEGARLVQPIPAQTFRPLGGAQQNNRGNTKILTLDTFNGQGPMNIASIIETPKANGDDAEVINVQLGLEFPPQMTESPGGGGYNSLPVILAAAVEWGIGGAVFSALADWNQGTAFSVTASFLRVSAQLEGFGPLALPPIDVTLKGTLGYGNSFSLSASSPLRRTVKVVSDAAVTLAAGGTSALLPIPPWALGFTLLDGGAGGVPVAPDYTIVLSDGTLPLAVYKLVDRTNVAVQIEGQFPIPAGARYVQVTNNLGVAMTRPKLIFNLAF